MLCGGVARVKNFHTNKMKFSRPIFSLLRTRSFFGTNASTHHTAHADLWHIIPWDLDKAFANLKGLETWPADFPFGALCNHGLRSPIKNNWVCGSLSVCGCVCVCVCVCVSVMVPEFCC